MCSDAGNEREESLHISKGETYLLVEFIGKQKVFFRIDNTLGIKDLGHHDRTLHISSYLERRETSTCFVGLPIHQQLQ